MEGGRGSRSKFSARYTCCVRAHRDGLDAGQGEHQHATPTAPGHDDQLAPVHELITVPLIATRDRPLIQAGGSNLIYKYELDCSRRASSSHQSYKPSSKLSIARRTPRVFTPKQRSLPIGLARNKLPRCCSQASTLPQQPDPLPNGPSRQLLAECWRGTYCSG